MSSAASAAPDLAVPSIFAVITGLAHLAAAFILTVIVVFQRLMMGTFEQPSAAPDKELATLQTVFTSLHVVFGTAIVALLVLSVFLFQASRWLRRRTHYRGCIIASVLCIPTFGVRLYGLYVLTQPAVRSSFTAARRG
jgi:Ni,Fe-hydrogenase I cytochrome b subunit